MKRLGQFILSCSIAWTMVQAQTVTIAWDPSPTKELIGYRVYRSNSPGGPYSLLTPSPTDSTLYIDDTVIADRSYYYVVSAIDAQGIESDYSGELEVLTTELKGLVNAGPEQVVRSGDTVILTVGGIGLEQPGTTIEWSQIGGPTIPLTGTHSEELVFLAPIVKLQTVFRFQIQVTGTSGRTGSDLVSVTVTPRM